MSRMVGTVSRGIRAPIIREGDDLRQIVTESLLAARLSRTGAVRYAIGVIGLFRRVQSEEFEVAREETLRTANALSAALGWRG